MMTFWNRLNISSLLLLYHHRKLCLHTTPHMELIDFCLSTFCACCFLLCFFFLLPMTTLVGSIDLLQYHMHFLKKARRPIVKNNISWLKVLHRLILNILVGFFFFFFYETDDSLIMNTNRLITPLLISGFRLWLVGIFFEGTSLISKECINNS